MKFSIFNFQFSNRGFTIFFATLVTSLALAIGLAIYDITVRELSLSGVANQSQYAIYAADTGAECALYWDTHCQAAGCNAGSAFPTSTQSTLPSSGAGLTCNGQDIVATPWTVQQAAQSATTTITVTFAPQPYCAVVTIAKSGTPTQTTVVSHGYNTCAAGGVVRLERALQVSY
ncbi:MAG: hypothetical protein AAB919_03545 [Patescibacteria group bacterium]